MMVCLYFGGIIIGCLTAFLSRLTVFHGEAVPFVMELPNYRLPALKNVLHLMWEKAADFFNRAFTIIFIGTIIIWFLQNFDFAFNMTANSSDSILSGISGLIAPIFKPLGFGDWRITTALISGILSKESVVSTLSVLYHSTSDMLTIFSPLACAALLVFCLLYTPCLATLASIKRECGIKWMCTMMILQCVLAWIAAYAVYTLGGWFL